MAHETTRPLRRARRRASQIIREARRRGEPEPLAVDLADQLGSAYDGAAARAAYDVLGGLGARR